MIEKKEEHELQEALSTRHLIVLGVSSIIGSGVFVLTGFVASMHAGPAVIVSFIISGFSCMCVALCYAELATCIPKAGGLYSYSVTLLSPKLSLLYAAIIIPSTLFSMSAVTISCTSYFSSFLSSINAIEILNIYYKIQNFNIFYYSLRVNIPSIFLIILITAILLCKNKYSIGFACILVIIKLTIIAIFLAIGFTYINTSNWDPFIPENHGIYGKFGVSGIISGASILILSYCGFESIGAAAQEVKDPSKYLPKSIIVSFFICIIIYTLISLVMTGLESFEKLNVLDPIAVSIKSIDISWLKPVITAGIIIGLISVLLAVIFGLSRVLYSVAKDGTLPIVFSRCSPGGTPYVATVSLTSALAIISSVLPTHILIKIANFGYLTMFITICVLVLILRSTRNLIEKDTYFKCPWVPFIPIFSIILLFKMWLTLMLDIYMYILLWLFFILIIHIFRYYFLKKTV